MIKFKTETGSIYEVDVEENKARRLSGVKDPTRHQKKDGEWKSFDFCSPIAVDKQVIFNWGCEPIGNMILIENTITSRVSEILNG